MLGGILLGLGASACWAVANVAVAASARKVGTVRALLWAQLVGIAVMAEVAMALDFRPQPMSAPFLGWIALAGVAGLLAYVCLFYSLQYGRLSIAVPIMSSWAVISSAIAVLGFGERLRPTQLVGAALVVAGVLLVSRHAQSTPGPGASPSPIAPGRHWLLAALGAAVGFGVLIPAMDRMAPATGRLGSVCVVYAADIVLGLPIALALRVSLRPPPLSAWGAVALAGLFETAGFVCIALGARAAPLAVVSPLASLASAITVVYAWLALRERPSLPAALGAALAAAGVLVLAI